ncbi:Cd(II)/Pb(II)-sensing metalloregulatory transcriptional regulator CmtR [Corynebacterium kalidii]
MLTISSQIDIMNRLGRAMADPNRSRILLSLVEAPSYPAQLSRDLDLSRTNVSNHLACLRGCGLVAATPDGRRTRYEIADPHLSQALEALVKVVVAVDDGEDACTEEHCTVPGCCADCSEDYSESHGDLVGESGRKERA